MTAIIAPSTTTAPAAPAWVAPQPSSVTAFKALLLRDAHVLRAQSQAHQ